MARGCRFCQRHFCSSRCGVCSHIGVDTLTRFSRFYPLEARISHSQMFINRKPCLCNFNATIRADVSSRLNSSTHSPELTDTRYGEKTLMLLTDVWVNSSPVPPPTYHPYSTSGSSQVRLNLYDKYSLKVHSEQGFTLPVRATYANPPIEGGDWERG
ncbi:hypothetical protein J6590_001688 [Homalodisca vitripennis]|nr:hypothetical protein J6590_001688 [Homalodisca vitripennis]